MVRLFFLFYILMAWTSAAAAPEVHARLVPERVKLGEPATLEIEVKHTAQQRYELKTPADLGDFAVLSQERQRATDTSTTFKVKLAAFQLGALDVPTWQLEATGPDGTIETAAVPATTLTVDSTLPPDTEQQGENLYDTHPPEEVLIRSWRLLYGVLAVLALAALGYALSRYLARPKKVAPAAPKAQTPLNVRTVQALEALASENLPASGQFRAYYFRLSEILRGYLGELYHFDALECTTPELLSALHSRTTPGLPMKELVAFAHASDYVRYAKELPSPEDCKAHLDFAHTLVTATWGALPPAVAAPPRTSP